MNLKELLDSRAYLVLHTRELLNKADKEKRSMDNSEQSEYDSNLVKIEELSLEIEHQNKVLFEEAGITQNVDFDSLKPGTGHEKSKNIQYFDKSNLKEFRSNKLEKGSLGTVVKAMITGDWSKCSREQRDAIGESGQGIWLIQTELSKELIAMALEQARVMEAGARFVPMQEHELLIPKITKMPDYEFKAENEAYASDEDVNFTGVLLEAKTLVSIVKLSVELAEDGYQVESAIQTAMAKAVSQGIDLACLSGSGLNNQPKGILSQDNVLEEDCNLTELTNYDHLSSAYFKVSAGNNLATALIAPSSLFAQLDLLKDLQDQPLKPPESYTLYQKLSSNQLVNNAVLGEFKNLLLGMRTTSRFEMTRLSDTAFQNLQVWLRIYTRFDCALALPEAFCNIKDFLAISS